MENEKLRSLRMINFHDMKSRNLYFKMSSQGVASKKQTFITVSVSEPIKVGDLVYCNWKKYAVVDIEIERPHERRKGFVFQKLIIKRTS